MSSHRREFWFFDDDTVIDAEQIDAVQRTFKRKVVITLKSGAEVTVNNTLSEVLDLMNTDLEYDAES